VVDVLLIITTAFLLVMLLSLHHMQEKNDCGFNGAGNAMGANFEFLFHDPTSVAQVESDWEYNSVGVTYTKDAGYWWLLVAGIGQFMVLLWATIFSIGSVTSPSTWCSKNPMTGSTMSSAFGGAYF
jgi:hypothetical protein